MSSKSLQAQINELKRVIDNHHVQHKLLKSKVTHLVKRIRVLEPFVYAEDRELFLAAVDAMDEIVDGLRERGWVRGSRNYGKGINPNKKRKVKKKGG